MQLADVMHELETMGSPKTTAKLANHGAPSKFFGVKVADMKTIVKKVKVNHPLALELYATGNGDAQYLAGLIADPKAVTKEQLQQWAEQSSWYMVGEYMVAALAADSPHGWELGLTWIESDQDAISSIGWTALNSVISIRKDEELNLETLAKLLTRVSTSIHQAPNRTRYTMNGFVIGVGCFVEPLSQAAMAVATQIGKVSVDMGGTACKVPFAPDYIQKVKTMGRLGRKRKKARC